MHVLVTGGAGFIGSAVVRRLVGAGHEVRVLDVAGGGRHAEHQDADRLPNGIDVVRGDVRDPAVVDVALRGIDAVSHQAAKVGLGVQLDDLPDYTGVNDLGTAVLLAAMARAGVRDLVLASSMVIYGEGGYRCDDHGTVPAPPRSPADLDARRFEPACPDCGRPLDPVLVGEDAVPDPRNGYAVSKLGQELLGRVWARESGSRMTALRYHNVYGPGLPRDTPYAGVAAIFVSALRRNEAPRVFEDGGQRRDFVHVDDVARANVAALEGRHAPTGGASADPAPAVRAFNVGSGVQRTVGDLADTLAEVMSGPAPVVTGEYRLGDVRHVTADTARIRRELDWAPVVDFREGLRGLVGSA